MSKGQGRLKDFKIRRDHKIVKPTPSESVIVL